VANSTGDVLSIIQQMTGLSSAIADAVENQNGATKGIAVNMQAAAARTATVSSTIQDLSRAAGTTGSGAHQVFNAADALNDLGRHLRQEVDVFLKVVEAA
jgi:methyl-accepting chemotaxis protein